MRDDFSSGRRWEEQLFSGQPRSHLAAVRRMRRGPWLGRDPTVLAKFLQQIDLLGHQVVMSHRAEAPQSQIPDRSFGGFYDVQRPQALRLAWLLTHDEASCEDIAQDAFTRVYLKFDGLENPAAYLRIVIVNRVREIARSGRREAVKLERLGSQADVDVAGPTGGMSDVIVRLPFGQRAAIVLRYWAGMSIPEIADALGARPGTVRSWLSRATETLRRDLQDE